MKDKTPAMWLRHIKQALVQRGIEDADSTARLMVTGLLQMSMTEVLLQEQPVLQQQARQLQSALQRRLLGEPVQYILEQAYFYGLCLRVTPDVLIPRMDTETLVYHALLKAKPSARVLDVCTGSGCVALAVKHERPDCQVTAVDLSQKALSVARDNGRRLKLAVDWKLGDLCEPVQDTRFDVVVSNPPYISREEYNTLSPLVREHEPKMALLAGEQGLDLYRRLIPQAVDLLTPGGWLCLEIGSSQADSVQKLCKDAALADVKFYCDLAGLPRVVCGRKG